MVNRVAVFGISGSTGIELSRLFRSKGWEISGMVRPQSNLPADLGGNKIVYGEFFEHDRIIETLKDCSAVCCVIGPRPPNFEPFCAQATLNIIKSMYKVGIKRLICITGAMIGSSNNRSFLMDAMAKSFARQKPESAQDRIEQENLIINSKLDWTIIKPPRLTEDKLKGGIKAGTNFRIGQLSKISRSVIANFIFDLIDKNLFIHERIYAKR